MLLVEAQNVGIGPFSISDFSTKYLLTLSHKMTRYRNKCKFIGGGDLIADIVPLGASQFSNRKF